MGDDLVDSGKFPQKIPPAKLSLCEGQSEAFSGSATEKRFSISSSKFGELPTGSSKNHPVIATKSVHFYLKSPC